jgi:glucose-1-phosphate thymidylyltransferase
VKGVILAGGTATRLFPVTRVTNKHLLPVHERPMLFYPLETLRDAGIRSALVIVGGRSVGEIVELIGDGEELGLEVSFRYQAGARGIADGIALARGFVGDSSFCVVLGDQILLAETLRDAVRSFEASGAGAGTLLYPVDDPRAFGVARFDDAGNLVGLVEKPADPPSNLASIGVYFFRADAFDVIAGMAPSARGELEVTDLLDHYARAGDLWWREYGGYWADAGTFDSLREVTADIAEGRAVMRAPASARA